MKAKILCVMVLAGAAANASAEEIKVTKKSGGQQVSDNLYGSVETRLVSLRNVDANGNTQGTRNFVLRPALGTKILDGKLDLNLTVPFVNRKNSAETEKTQPEAYGKLDLISSDRLDLYVDTTNFLQTDESDYEGVVDVNVAFKRNFDRLTFGTVKTKLLIAPEITTVNQKTPAKISRVEREDAAALSAAGQEAPDAPEAEQRETDKAIYVQPSVALEPNITPGLSFALSSLFQTYYKPKYVQEIDAAGESSLKHDGYQVTRATQVRYTVRYAVNERISLYNQLRQNVDGYLEAGVAKGNYLENRTGLTMDLF